MPRKWLAILAAIWLTAIGSSVVLIRIIDAQGATYRPASTQLGAGSQTTQEADEPAVETAATVLEMPLVTIEASRPGGVAEMQGTDDLTIGPGTVTHPASKPSQSAMPRRP